MSSAPKIPYRQVYEGSWIDWSRGNRILGATLTLSAQNGSLLIAFMALFVAWTGSQLWALSCYTIHQCRSTPVPRDALHHQQQILLRLGISNTDFLWRLLKTTWAWKNETALLVRRQGPLISFGVIHCAVIFVASLFISQLASSSSGVLIQPLTCGWIDLRVLQRAHERLITSPGADAFYVTAKLLYSAAKDHSRQCYTQTALLDSPRCNEFIRPTIDSGVRYNDPCPFQDTMCDTPAITLDTGLIDSHVHLGMNAPPANRVQFRKVLSCAIIPADRDHSTGWTTNSTTPLFPWDPVDSGDGIGWKYYNLGPQNIMGVERPSTYWMTNVSNSHQNPYNTFVLPSFIDDPLINTFIPIPALNRTDADITLLTLRNQAMYTSPVNDPFFKATKHRSDYSASFYTSDLDLGMIGCTEQYQFCNGQRNCSKLDAYQPSTRQTVVDSLGYNTAQQALVVTIHRTVYHARLFSIMFMLENTLLANELLYGVAGVSTGLPDNQWHEEVRSIHNISLAAMQQSAVDHVSPPNSNIGSGVNGSHTYDWIDKKNSTAKRHICQNQKIKSPGYYNFSILSLSLILIAGLLIIVTSLMAPSITNDLRRRSQWRQSSFLKTTLHDKDDISSYRTKEWDYSDPFHLQRIALEGHGVGPWTGNELIPLPFDRQKMFRVPWLTGWPGKTFFIDRHSIVV